MEKKIIINPAFRKIEHHKPNFIILHFVHISLLLAFFSAKSRFFMFNLSF